MGIGIGVIMESSMYTQIEVITKTKYTVLQEDSSIHSCTSRQTRAVASAAHATRDGRDGGLALQALTNCRPRDTLAAMAQFER